MRFFNSASVNQCLGMLIVDIEVYRTEGEGFKAFMKALGFHTTELFYLHSARTSGILLELFCLQFNNFTNLSGSARIIV